MIAVIKTGGKQYVVAEGQTIRIEKLEAEPGKQVSFETLMVADGDNVTVGTPILTGTVTGEVLKQGRAAKIEVVHYKPKVRNTKRHGHRQYFTEVKITKITA